MSAFYGRDEPVTVTTFAFTEDGEIVSPIYYIIKLRNENKFLKQTYRLLRKQNWTANLKKAVMFKEADNALTIAKTNFSNVTEET